MNNNFSELLNQVNQSEIFSAGRILQHIVQLINDPNASIADFKKAVELDPPLVAKILRISNSVYYGSPRKNEDLEQAIVWLGFNTIREIALSQKAMDLFQGKGSQKHFSSDLLWQHSIKVAHLNKDIHRKEFGVRGEHAYVAGLLHQLGIIVLHQFRPNNFKEIIETSLTEKTPIDISEKKLLGYTHAEIAAELLKNWNVSKDVYVPVEFHHKPDAAPRTNMQSANSLYLASSICFLKGEKFTDVFIFDEEQFKQKMDNSDISLRALEILYKDVEEVTRQMQDEGIF